MDTVPLLSPMLTSFNALSLSHFYLSLGSIALGLTLFLSSFSYDFSPFSTSCRAVIPPVTGFPVFDSLLCFLIPFFQQAVISPEGRFATMTTLCTALVFRYFMGIEAGRQGVSGLTRFAGFFAFLGQMVGLGSVANVFFVPAFFTSEAKVLKQIQDLSISPSVPPASSSSSSSPFLASSPLDSPPILESLSTSTRTRTSTSTSTTTSLTTPPAWWHFRGLNLAHVKLCSFLSLAMSVVISAMMNSPPISPAFVLLIFFFLFYPLAYFSLNLVHLPNTSNLLPLGTLAPPSNARFTQMTYYILAGFCMASYYEYLFELLAHVRVLTPQAPMAWTDLLLALPNGWQLVNFSSEPVIRFLLLDQLGIWLAAVVIMLGEGKDVFQILGFAAKSLVMSPGGAMAMEMAKREERITGLKEFFAPTTQIQREEVKLKEG